MGGEFKEPGITFNDVSDDAEAPDDEAEEFSDDVGSDDDDSDLSEEEIPDVDEEALQPPEKVIF